MISVTFYQNYITTTILLMQNQRPEAVSLSLKNRNPTGTSHQGSPRSPRLDRRKRWGQKAAVKKTGEELVMQAQQDLSIYVDNLDKEVNKVVEGNEAQFMVAYRRHFQRVQVELKDIRKNMLAALNDNQHYVEQIEALQKELVLFREESLSLSEIRNEKNQQIKHLKFQIKLLTSQKEALEKSLSKAFKQNKDLIATISNLKGQKQQSPSKMIAETTIQPYSRAKVSTSYSKQGRPVTMSIRMKSKRLHLGLESVKNSERAGMEMMMNTPEKSVRNSEEKHKFFTTQINKTGQFSSSKDEKKTATHFTSKNIRFITTRDRIESKSTHQKLIRQEVQRIRSQQLTSKGEYQQIFIDCVEQVKREVLRRSGITGLNYFKANGPKDAVEFKKLDYHLLLYLFLKNEKVIETVFKMLFQQKV